jgi:hypothetical protein
MSEDRKNIKISDEIHSDLLDISQKYGLPLMEIVSYLVDQCKKYEMLSPDWVDKLRDQVRTETLESLEDDSKLKQSIELLKIRASINAKMKVFQAYLDSMDNEEKKHFAEEILGLKMDNPSIFLENLTNYQLFKINGERKFLKYDAEGKPNIVLVKPENIIACDNGYHTKGGFCNCEAWRECEIRLNEYALYREKNPKNLEDKQKDDWRRLQDRARRD